MLTSTRKLFLLIPTLWSTVALASPEIPGADQSKPIALVGGQIHSMVGAAIDNGTLLFDEGRIIAVGKDVEVPDGAERIDVTGKHLYPGLFEASTNIGLIEINAVRATKDVAETGPINPNVRAEVAVNPDSELIPVARSGGVLLCLTSPVGGLISGSSTVLQLDGWTWEDMMLCPRAAMHVTWPAIVPAVDWWNPQPADKQIKERNKLLDRLDRFMESARVYAHAHAAHSEDAHAAGPAFDARFHAMLPVFDRRMPLVVHADEIQQILSAVAFSLRENVRLILHGGYDAPRCTNLLVKHDIPVIVGGVYRLPLRRSDAYDGPFTLPERLRQAGVRFCISGHSRFGASNVRNLPYHAAMAVAHGLPHDEALKSITLYPAQILGVDQRVGSLEVGKDATLIVTDGDPLEATTHVKTAYIQGRRVDLNDRHKRLWKKYQEKYRRLNPANQ